MCRTTLCMFTLAPRPPFENWDAQSSPFYSKHSFKMGKSKIEGYCHADYEPVRKHFEQMFKKGMEDNAQLCVYVGGECVVDLYGSATGDENFDADKVTVSFRAFFAKPEKRFTKLERLKGFDLCLFCTIISMF